MGTNSLAAVRIDAGFTRPEVHGGRPASTSGENSDRHQLEPEQGHSAPAQRKVASVDRVRSGRRQARRSSDRTGVTARSRAKRSTTSTPQAFTVPSFELPVAHWWDPLKSVFVRIRAALSTVRIARPERQLRVAEITPLGEKRFIAVIEFEGQRFLVGGSGTSVSLLSKLKSSKRKPGSGPNSGARGDARN